MYTNKFGHVFSIGDKVVAVVEGYRHRISTITGEFIGVSRSGNPQVLTKDGCYNNKTRISTLQRNLFFPLPKV